MVRHVLRISKEEANLTTQTRVAIAREGIVVDKENAVPCESAEKPESWQIPKITLESLTHHEVKRCTGFRDLKHALRYVAVVYAGDVDEMTKTATKSDTSRAGDVMA